MPFALIIVGILLFIAAYQNNVAALGSQISSDLIGTKGFIIWFVALFVVGGIGYIPKMQTFSRVFLGLILLVIFLSNKGFFTQLSALASGSGASSTATDDSAMVDLDKVVSSVGTTGATTKDQQTAQDAESMIEKLGDMVKMPLASSGN